MMKSIDKAIAALENAAMAIGALTILVLAGVIGASVLGRELFSGGVPDDIILAGLLMIPMLMLPLARVHREDGHIAVTVLTNWMSPRGLAFLKILANSVGLVFFGGNGWFLARKVPRDFDGGAYYDGELMIAVWPMKVVFAIGISLFVARLLLELIKNIRAAFGVAGEIQDSQ